MDVRKECNPDLLGDNLKYLKNLDFSSYNVIDVDAYGIPIKQFKEIFANETLKAKTIIFFTFIQLKNNFGALPDEMLIDLGYSEAMIKKIPSVFKKAGFEKFCEWLAKNGITIIYYIKRIDKIYGYFKIKG